MAISLTICNLALGDLRAPAIAEVNEASVEAQYCRRYYPHCLSLMLDDYTWQFTKRKTTLAQLTTNDRSSEWAYAFALPSDCGQALRLVPSATVASDIIAWTMPYDRLVVPANFYAFIVENGIIYTQIADATLEYASNEAEETNFPPLFREALRKLLAANLAVPLRDDSNLEIKLLRAAEAARQSAIANDMNRAPMPAAIDEVAWARR